MKTNERIRNEHTEEPIWKKYKPHSSNRIPVNLLSAREESARFIQRNLGTVFEKNYRIAVSILEESPVLPSSRRRHKQKEARSSLAKEVAQFYKQSTIILHNDHEPLTQKWERRHGVTDVLTFYDTNQSVAFTAEWTTMSPVPLRSLLNDQEVLNSYTHMLDLNENAIAIRAYDTVTNTLTADLKGISDLDSASYIAKEFRNSYSEHQIEVALDLRPSSSQLKRMNLISITNLLGEMIKSRCPACEAPGYWPDTLKTTYDNKFRGQRARKSDSTLWQCQSNCCGFADFR